MNTNVAVIPCRMKSSRLPGKPMYDICGKPMFAWVYENCLNSGIFDDVFVVFEGEEIEAECHKRDIQCFKSFSEHDDKTSRTEEFSRYFDKYSYYTIINGDDPLLFPEQIVEFFRAYYKYSQTIQYESVFGSCTQIKDPAIAIDPSNIKIALSKIKEDVGRALYLSRQQIPFPKNKYCELYKYTGIEVLSGHSLRKFVSWKKGNLEQIEDIDPLRWLENGIQLFYIINQHESVSVDTSKDLDYVRLKMSERIRK